MMGGTNMKTSFLSGIFSGNWCVRNICRPVVGLFVLGLLLAPLARAQAQSDWKSEWEKTVAAANKEGRVVIYHGSDTDIIFRVFHKKYPKIKVISVTGPTGPSGLSSRIMMEQRSGKFMGDLYILGATTAYMVLYRGGAFAPVKPNLMLPEVKDQSKWFGGRHKYIDEKGEYILSFNGDLYAYYAYNTNLVNPSELKSYWDFLNPKWKGKIIALDPTWGGPVSSPLRFMYNHPDLGPKYLKRLLTEMDITASRKTRQIADWLARGKFSLSLFAGIKRTGFDVAKSQGLPVDWLGPRALKEGAILSAGSGNLMLFRNAPHPNAARVAINWLLSREGQAVYQKIRGSDSRRIDIPKDDVKSYNRRVEGIRAIETDIANHMDISHILKFTRKYFKPKGR